MDKFRIFPELLTLMSLHKIAALIKVESKCAICDRPPAGRQLLCKWWRWSLPFRTLVMKIIKRINNTIIRTLVMKIIKRITNTIFPPLIIRDSIKIINVIIVANRDKHHPCHPCHQRLHRHQRLHCHHISKMTTAWKGWLSKTGWVSAPSPPQWLLPPSTVRQQQQQYRHGSQTGQCSAPFYPFPRFP